MKISLSTKKIKDFFVLGQFTPFNGNGFIIILAEISIVKKYYCENNRIRMPNADRCQPYIAE